MQRKYRKLREAAYAEALESFAALAAEPTFTDFVSMYIAEGFKRSRNAAAVGNSDPAVLLLVTRWFRRLTERPFECSLQYHADQDVDELRRFWAATLEVDAASIRLQRKSNSNQLTGRIWRCRHGVLTVRVNDTLFRARLDAWMDQVRASWR
jgi:hypothetical protein